MAQQGYDAAGSGARQNARLSMCEHQRLSTTIMTWFDTIRSSAS